jgi:hypothetical protein
MKKLEKLSKKSPFTVPEGYFDKLPLVIQAKLEATRPVKSDHQYFRFAMQYALPVLVMVVLFILVFNPSTSDSVEQILSTVSTEQLLTYLEENNLTTEELLNTIDFDSLSVEAIELEVYIHYQLENLELVTEPISDVLQNY